MRSVLVRLSRRGLYSEPLWGVYGKTPGFAGGCLFYKNISSCFKSWSRNKAHNGILSFFSWYILQSVTCHLLFVTLTYPVENTRVYKRASSPLCFLCVYVAFSSQQTTRTHWRKWTNKTKKERSVYFTDGVKDTYQMKPYIAPTAAELEQFLSSLN